MCNGKAQRESEVTIRVRSYKTTGFDTFDPEYKNTRDFFELERKT